MVKPIKKPIIKTVLVAGASGKLGRYITAEAKSQGYTVFAMSRDPQRAKENSDGEYEWVFGDVRDTATLRAAIAGADYVICSIGGSRNDPTNGAEQVDYGGVRNLVDAAVEADIEKFVLISSAGITHEDHFLNKFFNNVLIWKGKGEEHLRDAKLSYTIIRPGALKDGEPGQEGILV